MHGLHFECGFMCMVVKWKIIENLSLWSLELDCGEVEKHTKCCGYE